MDILDNVVLPLFGGIIGSSVTIFWTEINIKSSLPWNVKWKYIWLRAISGFVAVNLLNQGGTLSEKIPLAILAGLSPVSYLRGQSITDGNEEDGVLKDYIKEYVLLFEKQIELPDTDSEDEFVKVLKNVII